MINMHKKKAFVSIADDDEDADKITAYCERCKSYGFYHLLKPRIHHSDNGPPPHDADNWLQCYNCGTIVPKVHAQRESKLKYLWMFQTQFMTLTK
jgi:hypothetical protein